MQYSNYCDSYNEAPKFVDLFCGAGGLSLGFVQAGGIPIAAVDNDKDSIMTYKNMFGCCHEVQCTNIQEWDVAHLRGQVEAVIGGPPCQGFSLARGERFVDDPRNGLYKYFVKSVNSLSPQWFVMENVPGIISIGGGIILEQIYQDFSEIGYSLTHRVINMAEYGVPQTRKRTIFVGNRLNKEFIWPKPRYVPMKDGESFDADKHFRTVEMAVGDLPWPAGNYFSHRANSQMRGPRNREVRTQPAFTLRVRGDEFAFCEFPAVGAFSPAECPEMELSYTDCQNELQETLRELPPTWVHDYVPVRKTSKDRQSLSGTRRLSTREQARLQTFPDWFEFVGTRVSQSRQIGNAVPPLFTRQVFSQLIAALE